MTALNYVFNLMGFDSKFRGRRFRRSLRLYVKALVLKEILRCAEGLSIKLHDDRNLKSTLED